MNHFSPFEQISREQSFLYFNRQFIPGVQSIDFTIPENNSAISYIGQKQRVTVLNRGQFPQLNIQSQIIGYDKLFNYSGVNLLNAYIFKDKNSPSQGVQMISGAMESYSQRCSIGQIPETSSQYSFYGNCGTLELNPRASRIPNQSMINNDLFYIKADTTNTTDDSIRIAGPGSIEISTNQSFRSLRLLNTNSVTSYSFNLQFDRRPNFTLGNGIYPFSVDLKRPILFSAQLEIDLTTIEATDIKDFYAAKEISDLTITLRDHLTDSVINQYRFNSIELNSQKNQFNQNSTAKGSLEFFGSIF